MLDRFAFRRKFLQRGVRSAVCPACNRSGYTEWNLRQHLQKMHHYLPCKGCLQLFPEGADHECPLRNLACDLCPKRFTSLDGWTLHRKKVHRGVLHVCHVCGMQLASVNTLRRHMEVQHRIMPPPVGRHKNREPGVAPASYFCHKCGKEVKNRSVLPARGEMFGPRLKLIPVFGRLLKEKAPIPGSTDTEKNLRRLVRKVPLVYFSKKNKTNQQMKTHFPLCQRNFKNLSYWYFLHFWQN
jgi:hypothetical protein